MLQRVSWSTGSDGSSSDFSFYVTQSGHEDEAIHLFDIEGGIPAHQKLVHKNHGQFSSIPHQTNTCKFFFPIFLLQIY